jgi:lipopolysaccharide/colanic/teichoic acid biosynthesis glycosyltransferase
MSKRSPMFHISVLTLLILLLPVLFLVTVATSITTMKPSRALRQTRRTPVVSVLSRKRIFDFVASLGGLIVLSPLFLILALAIRFSSPGSIFYPAKRIGKDGKTFTLYKFRSMVIDADKIGPAVTGAADRRITPIGRILRRTKLDELPQLLNVLRGDMSLVGPRPEAPNYVALYTSQQREVLSAKPGITSPASVEYRNEEAILTGDEWEKHYIEEVMPEKLAIDLTYVKNPTLKKDFAIIGQTFLALLR